MGWWWDYVTRLVKTYPSFTRDFVMDELCMAEGWAWYAAAMELDGWLSFCGIQRVSDGYIRQQVNLLIEEAHRVWGKEKE